MSAVGVGLGLAANAAIIGGGYAGGKWLADNWGQDEAKAARQASGIQVKGAEAGQGTIQGATDAAQGGLQPYQQAGTNAVRMQEALSGAQGPEAQAAAFQALQDSPAFASLMQAGSNGILQNASATGGLRGGNTQRALGEMGPQLLQQMIAQQYGMLGGLSGQGLQAAGQSGQFGMAGAGGVAGLQQDAAAYKAGGILGSQAAISNGRRELIGYGSQLAGAGLSLATGMPMGGGGGQAQQQAPAYNPNNPQGYY